MYATAAAPTRATTSITLSAGMLNIPLSVYTSTEATRVSRKEFFNGDPSIEVGRSPIRKDDGTVIHSTDVTRMAQASNGTWVALDDDEIAACTSPKGVAEIVSFVPTSDFDLYLTEGLYQVRPKSVKGVPDRSGVKALSLLFAGLKARKVGILVKLAMRGPARYAILTSDGDLRMILTADAVRQPLALDQGTHTQAEIDMATALIDAIGIDTPVIVDDTAPVVQAYVDAKAGGAPKPVAAPVAATDDLMAALEASIKAAQAGEGQGGVMTGWLDTDLAGLRSNSSLAKVITEMVQNALDTAATEITVEITPDGRGLGRVVVTDNDPIGYVNLADSFTLFAPSTKANDDRKRGIFNMGEKEFLAYCVEGVITTMTGRVLFNRNGTRSMTKARTTVGSHHDFVMRMNREDQATMIAALREIVLDLSQRVTVNGMVLAPRPALLDTRAALPLFVASAEDPYKFVTLTRSVLITLHEPGSHGPTLHVLGMPVQSIECPYSINVHGRLKMDHARDQVAAPTVAKILATVTNALAERDKLTTEDAQGWAGDTLGRYTTPVATNVIIAGRFGPDAVVATPNHGANSDAASAGRSIIYGGALNADAWDAVKRARDVYVDLAPPSTRDFGAGVEGALDQMIPEHEWTTDAARVVAWAHAAFHAVFPDDGDIDISINGGTNAGHCIAAATRGALIFNQGAVGWSWFSPDNNEEIMATVVHEFGHHAAHQAEHSYAWGDACTYIAARMLLTGMVLS